MVILYDLGLGFYALLIRLAALWGNVKAKQWIAGRREQKAVWSAIKSPSTKTKTAWFHFSSLGEFEQGRPVLEVFRERYPAYRIIITFFSPSGYEIRKNYALADQVFYLPLDTARASREFIEAIRPDIVFFTKYDFWYHYFKILKEKNIPLYLVSAIFRENQAFFSWYGGFYRGILKNVSHFFVQDMNSLRLLQRLDIHCVSLSGDTRFDRVLALKEQASTLPEIESFLDGRPVLVAGSTWPQDEALLLEATKDRSVQLILVPHEIHETAIHKYTQLSDRKVKRLSAGDLSGADVLLVDSVGWLSRIYQYGNIGYIGGGFGKGIHNTLEAAVWALPLAFGPNYERFAEAKGLVALEAASVIKDQEELNAFLSSYLHNTQKREQAGKAAADFVKQHGGATEKILSQIEA